MSARNLGLRLGTRVRERREALGWSQAELAEAAGVTPNYVGVVERGEKLPTLQTLAAIADAFNVSMGALLSEEVPDAWADAATALIRVIPAEHQDLVMALLKAAGAEASRTKRPVRRYGAASSGETLTVADQRKRRAPK